MAKKKKDTKIRNLADLFVQNKKASFINFYLFLVGTVFFVLLAGWGFSQIKKWDSKVAAYDHVQGTLLKHERVTVRRGKSRSTESRIEYVFDYKGSRYIGNKIAYGEDDFPKKNIGSKIKIIVNPSQPTDSAAMIYYGTKAAKYGGTVGMVVIAAALLAGALLQLPKKRSAVPQKLLDYEKKFTPEEIELLRQRTLKFIDAPKLDLSGGIKYKFQRYAVITNSLGKTVDFIIVFLVIISVAGVAAVKQPILLIPTAMLVMIAFLLRPRRVYFDTIEKRFWKAMTFNPSKVRKAHDFSDIDFLFITTQRMSKGGLHFVLCAAKKNDSAVCITQVGAGKLPKLCDVALELTQMIGEIPLIAREA